MIPRRTQVKPSLGPQIPADDGSVKSSDSKGDFIYYFHIPYVVVVLCYSIRGFPKYLGTFQVIIVFVTCGNMPFAISLDFKIVLL